MVRTLAENLVTVPKTADLASLRRLISETGSKELARKIIEVAGKLKARNSGYLRLTKVGIRVGDKAVMTKVEFVFDEVKKVAKKAAVKKEKAAPVEAVEVKSEEVKEAKESDSRVARQLSARSQE